MPFYHFEIYDARPANDGGAIEPVKGSGRSGAPSFSSTIFVGVAANAANLFRTYLNNDSYFNEITISTATIEDMIDGTGAAFSQRIGKYHFAIKAGTGSTGAEAKSNATFQDLS